MQAHLTRTSRTVQIQHTHISCQLVTEGPNSSLSHAIQDEDALTISPAWLTVGLALLASITAALVSSAGVRLGKSYELAVRPPQGAAEIAGASWAQQALLHCSLVLPVLTTMLWVRRCSSPRHF